MRWTATEQNSVRVGKNSGPVLSRLWIKVHQILGYVGDPSYTFQRPCPLLDCLGLAYVTFRSACRHSPLSLEVVEKPNQCKRFDSQFSREGRPQLFYGRFVARLRLCYVPLTVWQSLVECRLLVVSVCEACCWQWSIKENYKMGKNGGPFWSRLWTKVHVVLRRCRRPLVVVNARPIVYSLYRASFRRYRPLKLRLSCEILEKGGLGPPICRGGDTAEFGHAFKQWGI